MTTFEFDETTRDVIQGIPHKFAWQALLGYLPHTRAQSSYVRVVYKGENWHLFNAKKINFGVIASKYRIS